MASLEALQAAIAGQTRADRANARAQAHVARLGATVESEKQGSRCKATTVLPLAKAPKAMQSGGATTAVVSTAKSGLMVSGAMAMARVVRLESAAVESEKQGSRCKATTVPPMVETPEAMQSGGATTVVAETPEAMQSGGATTALASTAKGGLMVSGAKAMRDQLEGKKMLHGAAKIRGMLPRGALGLQLKVPKRIRFGNEGDEGDAAHEAAMQRFSVKEFGSTSTKDSTILVRMQRVGAFGWWLQLNHYGKFVEWYVTEGERGKERKIVAVERAGASRVPSQAAMMECTKHGSIRSRPTSRVVLRSA